VIDFTFIKRERSLRRIPDMVIRRVSIYSRVLSILEIKDVSELKQVISEMNIKIVIITVPAQFAQKVADLLVDAGIKAILNFAPITISVPKNVILRNVDLSLELEALSFFLTHKEIQDNELSMLYICCDFEFLTYFKILHD
jgi:NADH/NAD ratio-sensing transcriptional regulator Rex